MKISTGDDYDNRDGSDRIGNWMQTFSGRQFWPLDPRPDEIFIEDIAHALANLCRYNGHCEHFYSVAEHSFHVSCVVPREMALLGLMHDATEAYVGDVIRPLKPMLSGYKDIEHKVWLAIAERFDLPVDLPDEVKIADNAVLLAEQAKITKPAPAAWSIEGEPADVHIMCAQPWAARDIFLRRFAELTE